LTIAFFIKTKTAYTSWKTMRSHWYQLKLVWQMNSLFF